MNPTKAVFFDRDGVLNRKPNQNDYVKNMEEFEWNNDAIDLICKVKQKGFIVIVVSNQRGVALGKYSKDFVETLHKKMNQDVLNRGEIIDAFYVCYHDIEHNCLCRKPEPGLLIQAQKDFCIDFSMSYLIGDSESDIIAANKVGCKLGILIESDVIDLDTICQQIV